MSKKDSIKTIEKHIKELKKDIKTNKKLYEENIERLGIDEDSPIGKKLWKETKRANKSLKKKIEKLNRKLNSNELIYEESAFLYLNKAYNKKDFDLVNYIWATKPIKGDGYFVQHKVQIDKADVKFFKKLFNIVYKMSDHLDEMTIYKDGKELKFTGLDQVISKYDSRSNYEIKFDLEIENNLNTIDIE